MTVTITSKAVLRLHLRDQTACTGNEMTERLPNNNNNDKHLYIGPIQRAILRHALICLPLEHLRDASGSSNNYD